MQKEKQILSRFDFIGAPILAGMVLGLFLLETRRALRTRKQSRLERLKTNAGVAAVAGVGLRWALLPAMVWAAAKSRQNHYALVPRLGLPAFSSLVISFLLLDYGNYWWHVFNHRSPLLWRLHNVHHTDLDLDVTTAWRFHLVEVLLSAFFRGGVAGLVGPPAWLVVAYEIVFEAGTAFHHSNWRVPYRLEKRLNYLIVTPRMHGIHHSIVQRETNSNFGVVFSGWDRLHHTLRLNIPQQAIDIGVPSYRDAEELTLQKLMQLPFAPARPWQLPDGQVPERQEQPNANHLLE